MNNELKIEVNIDQIVRASEDERAVIKEQSRLFERQQKLFYRQNALAAQQKDMEILLTESFKLFPVKFREAAQIKCKLAHLQAEIATEQRQLAEKMLKEALKFEKVADFKNKCITAIAMDVNSNGDGEIAQPTAVKREQVSKDKRKKVRSKSVPERKRFSRGNFFNENMSPEEIIEKVQMAVNLYEARLDARAALKKTDSEQVRVRAKGVEKLKSNQNSMSKESHGTIKLHEQDAKVKREKKLQNAIDKTVAGLNNKRGNKKVEREKSASRQISHKCTAEVMDGKSKLNDKEGLVIGWKQDSGGERFVDGTTGKPKVNKKNVKIEMPTKCDIVYMKRTKSDSVVRKINRENMSDKGTLDSFNERVDADNKQGKIIRGNDGGHEHGVPKVIQEDNHEDEVKVIYINERVNKKGSRISILQNFGIDEMAENYTQEARKNHSSKQSEEIELKLSQIHEAKQIVGKHVTEMEYKQTCRPNKNDIFKKNAMNENENERDGKKERQGMCTLYKSDEKLDANGLKLERKSCRTPSSKKYDNIVAPGNDLEMRQEKVYEKDEIMETLKKKKSETKLQKLYKRNDTAVKLFKKDLRTEKEHVMKTFDSSETCDTKYLGLEREKSLPNKISMKKLCQECESKIKPHEQSVKMVNATLHVNNKIANRRKLHNHDKNENINEKVKESMQKENKIRKTRISQPRDNDELENKNDVHMLPKLMKRETRMPSKYDNNIEAIDEEMEKLYKRVRSFRKTLATEQDVTDIKANKERKPMVQQKKIHMGNGNRQTDNKIDCKAVQKKTSKRSSSSSANVLHE